ncbi:MAG: hypothetical protein DME13_18235 [Candidatus Rokuibacteriota bacterium]|nr:MAG: hypothetical protein DME13_18235 [Candidatus Rokubacteria bacterium]
MMPRSTPITRPVTTAESPGWLDVDAEGSVDDAAPARAAGTMSTACTAITTCTRSPAAKRSRAPEAAQTCSGPRSESMERRPFGSTAVTFPATVC